MPRNGTPGFNGPRLKEAREARGLTGVSLAELVGVTPQAISQYEHDAAAPSLDKAYLLAAKLNVPFEFFLLARRVDRRRAVFYRSRAAATKTERVKAAHRLEWLEDIVGYVEHHVVLPDEDLPSDVGARRQGLSPEHIEDAATALRAHWALGDAPAPNIVRLLESKGVVVTRGVVETESIDAFSAVPKGDGRPCVFLGSNKDSAVRSRFDAAHELGHLVLHRSVDDAELDGQRRLKVVEDEANHFARGFLLPAAGFLRDLHAPTLGSMVAVKRRWMASVGSMIFRCRDLELLKPWEANRLWFARSRRGWQRQEPLDDQLPVETIDLLPRSLRFLVDSGAKTGREVADDLRLSLTDVESLSGLPIGSLSKAEEPVTLMSRRASPVVRFQTH